LTIFHAEHQLPTVHKEALSTNEHADVVSDTQIQYPDALHNDTTSQIGRDFDNREHDRAVAGETSGSANNGVNEEVVVEMQSRKVETSAVSSLLASSLTLSSTVVDTSENCCKCYWNDSCRCTNQKGRKRRLTE
jgi:hypothetical protein